MRKLQELELAYKKQLLKDIEEAMEIAYIKCKKYKKKLDEANITVSYDMRREFCKIFEKAFEELRKFFWENVYKSKKRSNRKN